MLSKWPGAENAHIHTLTWKTVCLDNSHEYCMQILNLQEKKGKQPEKSIFVSIHLIHILNLIYNFYHKVCLSNSVVSGQLLFLPYELTI